MPFGKCPHCGSEEEEHTCFIPFMRALEVIKAEKCYCYYHYSDEHQCPHEIAKLALIDS